MNDFTIFLDTLYGECSLPESIQLLANQPVMQRLRRIRLSNIDSISMPGIANVSRFEHSVGTAILAGHIGLQKGVTPSDKLIIQAAALLHDSAIPPFGHLVEEAFEYVSAGVNHEQRWSLIRGNPEAQEIGGIGMQIFLGRQAGLKTWADTTFGPKADENLREILETIRGRGKFGRMICGDLDLDNIDNVTRAAFHMGLPVDKLLSRKIAEAMVQVDAKKGVIFTSAAGDLVAQWLEIRKQLYARFMLSRTDFVGKAMLIFAVIEGYQRGEFQKQDWVLTDSGLLDLLLGSRHKDVSEPVTNWLCNELWPLSELVWMKGKEPSYAQIAKFSEMISSLLDRKCLAYRIKDKRYRCLNIHLENGKVANLGSSTNQWLLGVVSPLRKIFAPRQNKQIVEAASKFFGTESIGKGDRWGTTESSDSSLF